MALRVQIVDSLGSLLEPLAELLRTPTGALLMPELVAIPGIGVRLWLSEELARRLGTASAASSDGITTNIEFIFICGLVARARCEKCGQDFLVGYSCKGRSVRECALVFRGEQLVLRDAECWCWNSDLSFVYF